MADKFLTLYDVSRRDGTDAAVGLIEEVNTVAPELTELKGRPINGITYKAKVRTALPTKPAFRNANEGSDIVSSTYEQKMAECFFLDGQLRVDEAVLTAGQEEGNSFGDILADESIGILRQKAIALGDQFYRGTTADSKGFTGLLANYDATNCEVTAGAATATCSAWLVWNDPQGVYWVWGKQKGLELGEWTRQQVTDAGTPPKAYMAWVNNLSGYIGLGFGHTRCAVRIKGIKNVAVGSPGWLSDHVVAEALNKMPIFMRRSPDLRLLMNSTALLTLQKSRSTVNTDGTKKTDSALLQFAEPPEISNHVKIILTDSLPQTEA